jgi:hypothetical protein
MVKSEIVKEAQSVSSPRPLNSLNLPAYSTTDAATLKAKSYPGIANLNSLEKTGS